MPSFHRIWISTHGHTIFILINVTKIIKLFFVRIVLYVTDLYKAPRQDDVMICKRLQLTFLRRNHLPEMNYLHKYSVLCYVNQAVEQTVYSEAISYDCNVFLLYFWYCWYTWDPWDQWQYNDSESISICLQLIVDEDLRQWEDVPYIHK